MSNIRKTATLFISKELLTKTLDQHNISYSESEGRIDLEDKIDYYGKQSFVFNKDLQVFQYKHDSEHQESVVSFLQKIEPTYMEFAQNEQDAVDRADALRIQKENIIKRAKQRGYRVTEKQIGKKTKLILTKVA